MPKPWDYEDNPIGMILMITRRMDKCIDMVNTIL